jgi:hypothetical protein
MYINFVRTSQEAHYVSAAEPNWLMLCGETVAGYCKNRTELTDTLCGQDAGFPNTEINGYIKLPLDYETLAAYASGASQVARK